MGDKRRECRYTKADLDKAYTMGLENAVAVMLNNFGVTEPTLSELLALELEEETVKDWIAYVEKQNGINNPVGFLVRCLQSGNVPVVKEEPEKQRWYTDEEFKQSFVQPGDLPEERTK